jgi:Ca2+/Na+ antiporter
VLLLILMLLLLLLLVLLLLHPLLPLLLLSLLLLLLLILVMIMSASAADNVLTCVCAPQCRLQLPAGLDTGPVAIHLLSTQETIKGVLLGSATTMALPQSAAAELLRAYSLQIGDSPATQAEYQSALRDLVRDFALCWHWCRQRSAVETPSPGVPGAARAPDNRPPEPAVEPLLSNVLRYLTSRNMTACHALLADHRSSASASAASDTGSSDDSGYRSKSRVVAPDSPTPEALVLPNTPAAADEAAPLGTATPSPNGSNPYAQPHMRFLKQISAGLACLAAVSQDEHYAAWKLQQKQRVDMTGLIVTIVTVSLAFLSTGRRLLAILGFSRLWLGSMGALLLHVAPEVGTHLLLPMAGERLRARRDAVVVVFTAAKVLPSAAAALGWLPFPASLRQAWGGMLTAVVMNGMFRPCLQQVIQLLDAVAS